MYQANHLAASLAMRDDRHRQTPRASQVMWLNHQRVIFNQSLKQTFDWLKTRGIAIVWDWN
ncbi:MAG: hypothetical protein CMJ19_01970 [Phycisphaeraceae bacterium]|nr:hypothetical protein [Phycisphaeraceae bacterium]|tara:strand:- start:74 stop:256 length:183 start_codon:yes stop_codon:yes gene_type:complete